jgi:hypothetical protein
MAVKSTSEKTPDAKPTESATSVEVHTPAREPGQCVVDEPFHVGRAVNGKVCSYHAMRYKADGTPR